MSATSRSADVSGREGLALLRLVQDDTVAWRQAAAVSRDDFLRDVHRIALRLPAGRYAINLCEDRYWFLAGFLAILARGQTNLLPPSRAARLIEEIARDYDAVYCLADGPGVAMGVPVHRLDILGVDEPETLIRTPPIPGDQLAAVAFTSGSTGKARPHPKYWRDLITGARLARQRFGFGMTQPRQSVIATVPPQHMYGLEMSILNPLINGVSIYTGKTLFPADIQAGLASVPAPRILVTTPVHIRSCLAAGLPWPEIDYVISATSPLDTALASDAERVFGCPVMEIYGCTEAGSLASRRTLDGDPWTLYEHCHLRKQPTGHSLFGPSLPQDVPLHDIIQPLNDREFRLHGRHTDMVNIAGKRASLEDLNIRLRNIPGVEDAAFVAPDPDTEAVTRLAALVVAPGMREYAIRQELARFTDPVFLPRPLYFVDSLPRNETGKLPRAVLLELLRMVRQAD